VGNPAEETCCYPNDAMLHLGDFLSILDRKKSNNFSAPGSDPVPAAPIFRRRSEPRQAMPRFPAFTRDEFIVE